MRASEIIRRLADLVDAQETEQVSVPQQPVVVNVINGAQPDTVAPEVNAVPGLPQAMTPDQPEPEQQKNPAVINTKTMVPPLQQKLELMKKSAGIENSFDSGAIDSGKTCTECNCTPCECEQDQPDAITVMKRMAGIQVADEDEPFEG